MCVAGGRASHRSVCIGVFGLLGGVCCVIYLGLESLGGLRDVFARLLGLVGCAVDDLQQVRQAVHVLLSGVDGGVDILLLEAVCFGHVLDLGEELLALVRHHSELVLQPREFLVSLEAGASVCLDGLHGGGHGALRVRRGYVQLTLLSGGHYDLHLLGLLFEVCAGLFDVLALLAELAPLDHGRVALVHLGAQLEQGLERLASLRKHLIALGYFGVLHLIVLDLVGEHRVHQLLVPTLAHTHVHGEFAEFGAFLLLSPLVALLWLVLAQQLVSLSLGLLSVNVALAILGALIAQYPQGLLEVAGPLGLGLLGW
mmetsp:Transcript_34635/g.85869  ORF Transcript_34635/g.85869 Transcript_34635/m.85869 type:complete len:313 (+) Transcript_34635:482-1420(+)